MRARIVALAGIIALAACSNDPMAPGTDYSVMKALDKPITPIEMSNDVMPTATTAASTDGQLADNSWASATTGGTMDQYLDPNEWD